MEAKAGQAMGTLTLEGKISQQSGTGVLVIVNYS